MKRTTKTTKITTSERLNLSWNQEAFRYKKLPVQLQNLLRGTGMGGRGGITDIIVTRDWHCGDLGIKEISAHYRNGDCDVYEFNVYYPWQFKKNADKSYKAGEIYTREGAREIKRAAATTKAVNGLFLKAPGAVSVTTSGLIGGVGIDMNALNAALFAAGTGSTASAAQKDYTSESSEARAIRCAASRAGQTVEEYCAASGWEVPASLRPAPAPVIEEGL